jgi:hypothetical protein
MVEKFIAFDRQKRNMVVPSTNVGLVSHIHGEFGNNTGASNVALSQYYAAGSRTPASGTSVPVSGPISVSSFRGARCGPMSFRSAPFDVTGLNGSWSTTDSNMPDLTAHWVWSGDWGDSSSRSSVCTFQQTYVSASATSAVLYYTVDEVVKITLNNALVHSSATTSVVKSGNVAVSLAVGTNVFVFAVTNAAGWAGCRWCLRDTGNTTTLMKSVGNAPSSVRCSPYTPLTLTNFTTTGTTTRVGSSNYASPTIINAGTSNNEIRLSSTTTYATGHAIGWSMGDWGPVARMDFFAQIKSNFSTVGGMWLAFNAPTIGYNPMGSQTADVFHVFVQGATTIFSGYPSTGTYVADGTNTIQSTSSLPPDGAWADVSITYMWQPTNTWTWTVGSVASGSFNTTTTVLDPAKFVVVGARAAGSVTVNSQSLRYVNANVAMYRKYGIVFKRNDQDFSAPSTYSFRFARGTSTDDADALLTDVRNGSVNYVFLPTSSTIGVNKTHFKVWASTDYANNAGVWTLYTTPVNTALTSTPMSTAVGSISETVFGYFAKS